MTGFVLHPEKSLTSNLSALGITHQKATGRASFGRRDLFRDGQHLGAFSVPTLWAALRLHADGVELADALDRARREVA